MSNSFNLTIESPEELFFRGEADSLLLQTVTGEAEILPGHAALAGSFAFSPLHVRTGDHEEDFIARQGLVFVDPRQNSVRVLAYYCVKKADIDLKTIKEYMEFILKKMESGADLNKYQLRFLEEEKISLQKKLEVLEKE